MTFYDFNGEILKMLQWKKIVSDAAKYNEYTWILPNEAAKRSQVRLAEEIVGFDFPPEYVDFLLIADGWTEFGVLTDLYGTKDFIEGRHISVLQSPELKEFVEELGLLHHDVTVVGSNAFDLNVFLLVSKRSPVLPGGVIWFDSGEVDRFVDFGQYFGSMTLYCEQSARRNQS